MCTKAPAVTVYIEELGVPRDKSMCWEIYLNQERWGTLLQCSNMLVHVVDVGGTREQHFASQPQTPLHEVPMFHPFLHLGYSQGRDWLRMSEAKREIQVKDTYFRLFLVI